MPITVVDTIDALQKELVAASKEGKRVALVPTMGALHAGHMALVNAAKEIADYVVVSIFVNPTQFGPNEDFQQYPRTLEADVKLLEGAGVSLVYTPTAEDMYPPGFATVVSAGELGEVLCGKSRPGHFNGVATVVIKLLLRVLPHVALFGEKDYQQLCVIRQVVYDLDVQIAIVGVPTVREADGLAMSSRNAYLTKEERQVAPKLYQSLQSAAAALASGAQVETVLMVEGMKLTQAGFQVDYFELCDADGLFPLNEVHKPCRLLVAARLGKTRLIDNIAIE